MIDSRNYHTLTNQLWTVPTLGKCCLMCHQNLIDQIRLASHINTDRVPTSGRNLTTFRTSLDIAGECHSSSRPRTFSSLQLFMPSFWATCHWGSSTCSDLILEPAYPTSPQPPNSTQKVQISLQTSVLLWGSASGSRSCNKKTSLFSKVFQKCLRSILATKRKKEEGRKFIWTETKEKGTEYLGEGPEEPGLH